MLNLKPNGINKIKRGPQFAITSKDLAELKSLKPSYDQKGESWISTFTDAAYHKLNNRTVQGIDADQNGIYLVMMDKNTIIPFLDEKSYRNPTWYSSFCGTHTFGKNSIQMRGDVDKIRWIISYYPTMHNNLECIPQQIKDPLQAPNQDPALDAMINVIAHELAETVTGYDISNPCVYKFGNIKTFLDPLRKKRLYTEQIGSKKYFIQQNYNYKTDSCESG